MKTHIGHEQYQCAWCEKAYSWKRDLNKHVMTHNGEKPYECSQCEKAFSQKINLDQHMMTHTEEKPYQCNQCEISFQILEGCNLLDLSTKFEKISKNQTNLRLTHISVDIRLPA